MEFGELGNGDDLGGGRDPQTVIRIIRLMDLAIVDRKQSGQFKFLW